MTHHHDGQGGSYIIDEGGDRKLVERTREPGDTPADPASPPPAEPTIQIEPADAGFFSPVAPADHSTTE